MEPSLKGIFYAEFDNVAGPKIAYQTPEGLISPDQFDSISQVPVPAGR